MCRCGERLAQKRARPRTRAEVEHTLDVLRPIDVQCEERIVNDGHEHPQALGALDDHRRAVEDAECGLEDVGRPQGDRVGAPVLGGRDRDGVGGVAQQVECLRAHERAIGHHDERPLGAALGERHGDCGSMPAAGVDQNLDLGRRQGRIRRHHENSLDGPALPAGFDNVPEHRLHEAGPELGAQERGEPTLGGRWRIDRDDGEQRTEHTLAKRLTVLCGGLGGSRLVDALARVCAAENVTAVGNVGDDLEILGLAVSPDLDTVLYTLAGLLDEGRGWGVREETYAALERAARLGGSSWFTLGDRDIGLHLVRTERLRRGATLSAVTEELARALEVSVHLLPATDDPVRTKIVTDSGELEFQEWFVARRHTDPVRAVRYVGADKARPAPGVIEALDEADAIVLAPSNPFVSIHPILAVPGIAEAIRRHPGPVAAVSPLVGGRAIRGPLAGMMETLGHEPTALGVARLYADLADVLVLDRADAGLAGDVESLGQRPVVCETVMVDPGSRERVGRQILEGVFA